MQILLPAWEPLEAFFGFFCHLMPKSKMRITTFLLKILHGV
jgi:hypothetical protein